jgi:hypothetical protein
MPTNVAQKASTSQGRKSRAHQARLATVSSHVIGRNDRSAVTAEHSLEVQDKHERDTVALEGPPRTLAAMNVSIQ